MNILLHFDFHEEARSHEPVSSELSHTFKITKTAS